ncbi:hypothetical protein Pmani_003030 [Petrolisthes manimaculis]|uniref:Uncharacterized protein n=1 Tax=Petrolisthes manimaculis TaxID=1843537 RepID=A0AAE1QGS8_9EUCA|nr:hypothetical protein Pmani_003030 [Petrolisthes manimaculis]
MKFVLVLALATVAVAMPDSYEAKERKFVPIIRDERIREDDGRYNFDVETGNGILISQSGSPVAEGAIAKAGEYSYTAPNGEQIYMKFVADENGFQPQSSHLPVAPEFPHPIPQFVLDQIQRAAEEDAARARAHNSRAGNGGTASELRRMVVVRRLVNLYRSLSDLGSVNRGGIDTDTKLRIS